MISTSGNTIIHTHIEYHEQKYIENYPIRILFNNIFTFY